jgi:hypothetical protein
MSNQMNSLLTLKETIPAVSVHVFPSQMPQRETYLPDMTENSPFDVKMPSTLDDMNPQTVESSQSISDSDEIPCEDRDREGHTQWTCNRCRERLDGDFDEILCGSMLTDQDWTEKQIDAIGSLCQFDKAPWTELMPDASQPKTVQLRTWGWNCVQELQARMDAARECHEVMTAQHHLQNEGKVNLTTSSADEAACKDNSGNELHPQWTCHRCLARLDDHLDRHLHESMLDQGRTEAQIDAVGSLRQFDTKPWTEMVPESSQPQLIQVRAWGSTRLQEIEARTDNARAFHKARFGSEEVVDKVETEVSF